MKAFRRNSWNHEGIFEIMKEFWIFEFFQEISISNSNLVDFHDLFQTFEILLFSKVTMNKTKLRNRLHISTLESIICVSEHFPATFEPTDPLKTLYVKARGNYMAKYSEKDAAEVDLIWFFLHFFLIFFLKRFFLVNIMNQSQPRSQSNNKSTFILSQKNIE